MQSGMLTPGPDSQMPAIRAPHWETAQVSVLLGSMVPTLHPESGELYLSDMLEPLDNRPR